MKGGKEEFSDRKVTIFLIAAILISLVSTLSVLVTLNDVTSNQNEISSQPPIGNIGGGVVSLVVLEKKEPTNGTK